MLQAHGNLIGFAPESTGVGDFRDCLDGGLPVQALLPNKHGIRERDARRIVLRRAAIQADAGHGTKEVLLDDSGERLHPVEGLALGDQVQVTAGRGATGIRADDPEAGNPDVRVVRKGGEKRGKRHHSLRTFDQPLARADEFFGEVRAGLAGFGHRVFAVVDVLHMSCPVE